MQMESVDSLLPQFKDLKGCANCCTFKNKSSGLFVESS